MFSFFKHFPVLLLFGCSTQSKHSPQNLHVAGVVTVTSSYCGGMMPTDEDMAEYNKPKPYQGKTLYFRKGQTNDTNQRVVAKVTTNDSGYFSINLPVGAYAVLQEEQLRPLAINDLISEMVRADTACLKKWWLKPLFMVQPDSGSAQTIRLNFHKACFVSGDLPCLNYTGPMPP